MNKIEVRQEAFDCVRLLRNIDFEQLGLSPYNLEYIQRLLPDLEYYFRIYTDSILILLRKEKETGYVIDYGGGHGFLSFLLKKLGFKVIYCDHNPLSIKAVSAISEKLGFGPDHIVEGGSTDLLAYCVVNKLKPAYLIATDLIEHVYDLNTFFADLHQINPGFKMIFTTGSNPSNPYKVRNLRKMMVDVEQKFFLPMREEYIQKNYPDFKEDDLHVLALQTRGLTYKDIDEEVELYINTGKLPEIKTDKYNTCDPQNGNWMERILPLATYRKILKNNGFKVEFKKGFYNEKRDNVFAAFTVKALNKFIKYSGRFGRRMAAYLILKVSPRVERDKK